MVSPTTFPQKNKKDDTKDGIMSKLLLDEQPLLVLPKLAHKIGLNESIVVQQIHYWNEINKKANNNFKDGYYWTYNSYEKWMEQFPFWGIATLKRTFSNLEKQGIVVSANYNTLNIIFASFGVRGSEFVFRVYSFLPSKNIIKIERLPIVIIILYRT